MIQNDNEIDDQPSLDDLIPLSQAAKISGFTRQHLALLIRQGNIWGTKLGGRDWFTTEQAVKEYLIRDRRPGPKTKKDA
jgi:hypothetical protein